MPPWYADPGIVHFANDRTLPPDQIARMMAWIDGGTPAGNPKDAPPPRAFAEGWQIGQPDLVVELPNAFLSRAHGGAERVSYRAETVLGRTGRAAWTLAATARPAVGPSAMPVRARLTHMMPSTSTVAVRAAQIITIKGLESPLSTGCCGSSRTAFSALGLPGSCRSRRSRVRTVGSMG